MKKFTLFLIILILFSFGTASAVADKDSSCVKCHTDAALMKSLFVPPVIDGGEGEG